MRNKFTSLNVLKQRYPRLAPFYTQSWVYSAITAYYSQQNRFAELEFSDVESELVIHDHALDKEFLPDAKYYGLVFEGHLDYWAKEPIPKGSVVISGHQHFNQTDNYTSLGFDYWDVRTYNEFSSTPLYYELNHGSVSEAEYDAVIPTGFKRYHRITFLEELGKNQQNLTIVTDDRQQALNTDLRFTPLGIEVYLNKVGLKTYQSYQSSPSFYNSNYSSIDRWPHKRMHSIARVNVVLETTVNDTVDPYTTEKTWKVLAQHRPFIVYGDTKILKKLQAQGFQTFGQYCDESYDAIVNPKAKAQGAIRALHQLVDACKKYPDEIDRICKHNQELFFNQQRHTDNLATFGKRILEIVK